jgi:hypothetical protein
MGMREDMLAADKLGGSEMESSKQAFAGNSYFVPGNVVLVPITYSALRFARSFRYAG